MEDLLAEYEAAESPDYLNPPPQRKAQSNRESERMPYDYRAQR